MKFTDLLNEGMLHPMGDGESLKLKGEVKIKDQIRNSINKKIKETYFKSLSSLTGHVMDAFKGTDVYPIVGSEKWLGSFSGSPNTEVIEKLLIDLAQGDNEVKNARLVLNIYK
jgi:hypothetical protein